ncbi:MAG: toll/interleukin-1 receptor domain-containing protein [Gammaproteobacteria bacterium]|nr:toll/interleukin-1 receptor domain-containing protein [Gammaproteobacteria bacterium]
MTKRTQIFVSYSHADSEHLQRLKVHLRPFERQSLVDVWADTKINAGQLWKREIEEALERAAVAILLISADFLASDFVATDELPPLLKAAEEEGVKILPVILKPCAFTEIESLSQFQAVNNPSHPLISLDEAQREQHWFEVASSSKVALADFEVKEAAQTETVEVTEGPLFGNFGWAAEILSEEIRNPECVHEYHIYQYMHIDVLEYMPTAEVVLQHTPNREEIIKNVKNKLLSGGWEGDGEIQILWIPPFIGAGVEDTWGLAIWFVKQSNNGTAYMASPVSLPFSRLLEQQW